MKSKQIKQLLRQYIFFDDITVLKYPEINNIIKYIPNNIIIDYCIIR